MIGMKKVLYPTDFSACAKAAFGHAVFLAEQFEAELHVLHVATLHGEGPGVAMSELPQTLVDQVHENAASELQALLAPHQGRALQVKEFSQRALYAEPAILSHIEREDIDLVVMGTHGRRGWKRAFLGSVAEEVIRHADCPVLAVHHREEDDAESVPSLGTFQKLVVPIDFSEHSRIALIHAVELAGIYDAELHLIHVVNPLPVPAFYSPLIGSFEDALFDELAEKSRKELQQWVEELAPGKRCQLHLKKGDTAEEISALTETLGDHMIVMATHGLTGLKRWFLGKHTERVIRYAEAPVFVVKSFGGSLLT